MHLRGENHVYVTSISISGLRSFREAEVDFCQPGTAPAARLPNVTLLLGDNGAGKTSVLRAIALAALAPIVGSSGFHPYRLVRRTRTEELQQAAVTGRFLLHAQDLGTSDPDASESATGQARVLRRGDLEQVSVAEESESVWEAIFHEISPAFLIVGYGAGRRVETSASFDSSVRAKSRFVRYQRVAGLFEEQVTLTPLSAWLPEFRRSDPERHEQVIALINNLLPDGSRILDEPENGEYIFEQQETRVPFAALSDGYRAFIGWIADLLYHVCTGAPAGSRVDENRGIVLVDEVDLHLHPAWQRVVVPQLARTLPNLQFVLTSHSPLVVGTLHADNLRLIEPDETGASVIKRLEEHVHGLTADQILVSSYFGLHSPRAPQAVSRLAELSRQAQQGDNQAAREFLEMLSASTFSDEERDMMAQVDLEQI